MRGYQQERVKDPRPVRLAEIPAQGIAERGHRGHQPARQFPCVQVERRGDDGDSLPEPGGAAEPDQGGGYVG